MNSMCPLIVKLDIGNCRWSAWGCMFFFFLLWIESYYC